MSGEVKMGGGFNGAARSQMSPGLLRQIAAQEEQEARQAAEERRKREAKAEAWRSRAVQSAVAEALDAGEQFSPQMLEGHGLGHTQSEFVALVSARQDHEDAMAAAREWQEFRRWQEERSASMSDRVGSPARRVGPGAGPGATVNAEREQVAAAAAAVALGEDTATAYWQAAAQRPGVGALVALQSTPGVVGEAYNVPAGTPAIRPQVRPEPIVAYASPVVGGVGPSGYHGTAPGSTGGALEGVPVPSLRSDPIVYVSGRLPSARPSLGDRLRGAWKALWGR